MVTIVSECSSSRFWWSIEGSYAIDPDEFNRLLPANRCSMFVGKCEGSRLDGGTRLVVFPCFLAPCRPKNTTSRDPYPLRAGTPLPAGTPPPLLHLFGKGQGVRGPGSRWGPGSWLSWTVGGLAVGIPRAGSPQQAGTPCLSWVWILTGALKIPLVVGTNGTNPSMIGRKQTRNDQRDVCFDTQYDRAKVPPYNGNDPRPPLVV